MRVKILIGLLVMALSATCSAKDADEFTVFVNLTEQNVIVQKGGKTIRKMTCSSGKQSTPTPKGEFKTMNRQDYIWYEEYGVGVHYATRINPKSMFHSVLYDKEGNLIQEEFKKLGQPVSGGCVRLIQEDAKWIYDNLPLGTTITVR